MRIIAGKYRGTRLAALGKGDAGAHLRPTTDRVRESLFNVLNAYVDWPDCRVLDLFAGTGALGFEALSRGALDVTFVENGRVGQKLIAENVEKLRAADVTRLVRGDACKLGPSDHRFDVVFLDPPYGKSLGRAALLQLTGNNWLAQNALVVWEENAPQDAPEGFVLHDTRRYGDTHVTLLQTV